MTGGKRLPSALSQYTTLPTAGLGNRRQLHHAGAIAFGSRNIMIPKEIGAAQVWRPWGNYRLAIIL